MWRHCGEFGSYYVMFPIHGFGVSCYGSCVSYDVSCAMEVSQWNVERSL